MSKKLPHHQTARKSKMRRRLKKIKVVKSKNLKHRRKIAKRKNENYETIIVFNFKIWNI
jgi:hypothetical protein